MDSEQLNEMAKTLCDEGRAVSMAQARRMVLSGSAKTTTPPAPGSQRLNRSTLVARYEAGLALLDYQRAHPDTWDMEGHSHNRLYQEMLGHVLRCFDIFFQNVEINEDYNTLDDLREAQRRVKR